MRLVPFANVVIDVKQRFEIGRTPFGSRLIGELSGARWEGERFRAKMIGAAAADWAIVSDDGLTDVDVRMTLETDDGALVYARYAGVLDPLQSLPIRTAMRFETADPRYAWMVRTLFVAGGTWDGEKTVRYAVFELAAPSGLEAAHSR